jgi:hypothetical protein
MQFNLVACHEDEFLGDRIDFYFFTIACVNINVYADAVFNVKSFDFSPHSIAHIVCMVATQ